MPDRYERFESLGENEYVTVYRGWDTQARRPVAIMELNAPFRVEPQFHSVWADVQQLRGLRHPGLVRLDDLDAERGWIITELMKGTVASTLAGRPLSSDAARTMLWATLEALEYLHGKERLHGDVRPNNLLVDDQGTVRLSQPLGLALGGQVPRKTINQKYLAPELTKPEEFGDYGRATDLYCLGFSVYELLVGKKFDGLCPGTQGPAGWFRWHSAADQRLPPLREVVPDVAPEVAETIDRLVAKRVEERPASAEVALTLLKPRRETTVAKLGAPPVPPKPSSPPQKSFIERFNEPRVFWPVAAVVLSLAAIVGLGLQSLLNPDPPHTPDVPGKQAQNDVPPPKPDKAPESSVLESIKQIQNSLADLQHEMTKLQNQQAVSQRTKAPDASALVDLRKDVSKLQSENEDLRVDIRDLKRATEDFIAASRKSLPPANGPRPPGEVPSPGPTSDQEILAEIGQLKLGLDRLIDEVNRRNTAKPIVPGNAANGWAPSDLQSALTALRTDVQALQTVTEGNHGELVRRLTALEQNGAAAPLVPIRRRTYVPEQPPKSAPEVTENYAENVEQLLDEGRPAEAIAEIKKAQDQESVQASIGGLAYRAYMQHGRQLLKEKQHRAAHDEFSTAFRYAVTAGQKADALGYRSIAHVSERNYDKAIQDFEQATEHAPDRGHLWAASVAAAYYERGRAANEHKRHREAVRDYYQCLSLDPDHQDALLQRGRSYFALGDDERAVRDFDRVIQSAQKPLSRSLILAAVFGRARANAQRGLHQEVIDDCTEVIRVCPDYALAYVIQGMARAGLGEHKAAIADFDRGYELDRQSYAALNNRGLAYLNLGQCQRAVDDFTAAVKVDGRLPNAYYNRHLAYTRLGILDKADADLARARQLSPGRLGVLEGGWRPARQVASAS